MSAGHQTPVSRHDVPRHLRLSLEWRCTRMQREKWRDGFDLSSCGGNTVIIPPIPQKESFFFLQLKKVFG